MLVQNRCYDYWPVSVATVNIPTVLAPLRSAVSIKRGGIIYKHPWTRTYSRCQSSSLAAVLPEKHLARILLHLLLANV